MVRKLTLLIAAATGVVTIMTPIMPASAGWVAEPDKPILAMKPNELFSKPQLRQLAVAAQHGNVQKIDDLIAQGADVNGKGKYGIAPLFSAWQARNKAGFETLLDKGANPNNVWTTGETLMNLLAGTADPYFLKSALKHGGNANLVEPRTGQTPLLAAVIYSAGRRNIPTLIGAGANLDYQTPKHEETATMVAAGLGQFKVVYELLAAGAGYRLTDANDRDLRDSIISFSTHNISQVQCQYRRRVIAFLKQHHFWMKIAPPSDLRVSTFSVPSGGFYTLSWTSVPSAKTYDLSLNGKIKLTGITGTEVRLRASASEVNESGYLAWSVRACNEKGCSDWSIVMTIAVTQSE